MQIEQKITAIIEKPMIDLGYELVRVKYFNIGKRNILQIMIDRLDGNPIVVDDCEKASHTVSALLDVEDPIAGEYSLEVSSPGIDRPLIKPSDFIKHIGFEIALQLFRPISSKKRIQAKLIEADEDKIKLAIKNETLEVDFQNIESAKLALTKELLKQHSNK